MELYNLKDDIGEMRDLAAAHPDITRRLHGLLVGWREKVGAKLPERNPDYRG